MGEISDALARASKESRHRTATGPGPSREPELSAPSPPHAPEPAIAPACHAIPRDASGDWLPRLCAVDPDSMTAVRFRQLAVRVQALLDERSLPSLLVTSALPGEGKTTVAANLAIGLASVAPSARIALVDLDLRCGRVGHVFGYEAEQGLEDVLAGEVDIDALAVPTDLPALDFFPIANRISDAHRLIGGFVGPVLARLHQRYSYVICDSPPVLPVPDVPLIAPHVGGCLLVAASGRTRHRAFRTMMEHLPAASVLGVFLNGSSAARLDDRYTYYQPEAEPTDLDPEDDE